MCQRTDACSREPFPAKAVVEIGTGSGVSGLALFAGMQPDGVLTSVDIEPEHQHAARKAFLSLGIPTQRFRLISGAALSVLPRLSDGAYDMVFIDADKSEYPEYVEQGLRLLRHGGLAGRRQCSVARPDGRSGTARRTDRSDQGRRERREGERRSGCGAAAGGRRATGGHQALSTSAVAGGLATLLAVVSWGRR